MRATRFIWPALSTLPLLIAAPGLAQPTGTYSAPTEFMQLFFDFTGSNARGGAPSPLVLVVGSDIQ